MGIHGEQQGSVTPKEMLLRVCSFGICVMGLRTEASFMVGKRAGSLLDPGTWKNRTYKPELSAGPERGWKQ